MMKTKTISVSIQCKPGKVYNYASKPENLPKWAGAFCLSVKKSGRDWIIETPEGPMKIAFAPQNEFGVLDHYVTLSPGVVIYNPMRVIPNGYGSEITFTLFQQPSMSEKQFKRDMVMVRKDLNTLKKILEGT